jgi:hypothetical protein
LPGVCQSFFIFSKNQLSVLLIIYMLSFFVSISLISSLIFIIQPIKTGQVVHPRAVLLGQRAVFKTELSHLAWGGADQTELQPQGNSAATWLKQQQL